MAHKGIREFETQELSSIALGQNGFHILSAGETTAVAKKIKYWVAIKAIDADAIIEAQSIADGDDFTKDSGGIYQNNAATDGLTIGNGDIIYGAFDKINIATGDFAIAYIGR